jgi:secreted trypsin-like serine protease
MIAILAWAAIGAVAAPVRNGQPSAVPAAVALIADGRLHCSGVLVGERVVLTAGHCARTDLSIAVGATLDAIEAVATVREAIVHPTFDRGSLAHDLAVLILDEPGLPVRRQAISEWEPAAGAVVDVVGFGDDGAGVGVQRAGSATVASSGTLTLALAPGPALPCGGDSGGPVMYQGALVALVSRGDPRCDIFAVATRVDREFVEPIIEALEPGGCSAGQPSWLAALALLAIRRSVRSAKAQRHRP